MKLNAARQPSSLECPPAVESLPFEDSYRFLDVGLKIRSDSRALLEHLQGLYPRFRRRAPGGGPELRVRMHGAAAPCRVAMECGARRYLLFTTRRGHLLRTEDLWSRALETLRFDDGGVRRVSPCEISSAIEGEASTEAESHLFAFVQLVLLRTLALLMPRRHLLHAAALAWKGAGVVLPGVSGRGKTLLALALAKHGFAFLADDVACLDLVTGDLEPFPRSLNLCASALPLLASLLEPGGVGPVRAGGRLDIERFFPGSVGQACPLRWVILLEGFGPRPSLRPISRHRALWRALEHSHGPVTEPGRTLFRLAPFFQRARCYELTSGDLDATATLLARRIGGFNHAANRAS